MRTTEARVELPKSKGAALRLAAGLALSKDQTERRRQNIMKHSTGVTDKIERLKEELQRLENQKEELLRTDETNEALLKKLQIEFDLTEAEILDVKLALIKKGLSNALEAAESSGLNLSDLKHTDS